MCKKEECASESAALKKEKKTNRRIVKRVLCTVGIFLLSLLLAVILIFLFILYSPWTRELRDRYILMTYMTSNPWLCTTFFSQETIDRVFMENGSEIPDEPQDPSLITPHPSPETGVETGTEETKTEEPQKPIKPFHLSEKYPGESIYDDGEVQIVQFSGTTPVGKYTARLIQIKDPSRVFLGVTNRVGSVGGSAGHGQLISDFCTTNDALCGINASGFVDEGGVGSGGIPLGTVIKNGIYTVYTNEWRHSIIGFDENNMLVMGEFTEEECRDRGIRDAMSWRQPALLILNGKIVEQYGLAGGYDPRSAIGQCADGTVLLLVVDGSSLRGVDGANFALMADILYSYGAVNAANLDGGTSSCMALNGKLINTVCNPPIAKRGRYLATAWLVRNEATPQP